MSSKTIERPAPAVISRRRRTSIATRLVWWYVITTAALLLVADTFHYWGLGRSLRVSDEQLMASKVSVLRTILRDPSKTQALESEVEHESGEGHAARYFLRIATSEAQTLLETEGMSAKLPAALFPTNAAGGRTESPLIEYRDPTGRHFLLLTAHAISGGANPEPRVLQIARDTSFNRELLYNFRQRLLIVLAGGTALAAFAGVLVARAGLRPLRDITHTTRQITASQLDQRLTAATWPAELRELAGAFDAMLDRLQDSFNRLSEFSADLAHALRNPINNLRGETEVALTRVRTSEEYRQTLTSGLEELERLSRLTEGLLFIARADDPRMAIEHMPFNVRREIDAVRDFYDALAADHRVTVTCEGSAEITGDPMLVRRAISNLLANALKHTPPGGQVTLAARARDDRSAEVTVSDTGCGISPEHLPKLFNRFFQVNKTRDSTANGAGLGLAIVRSIMRLQGGTASVESVVGKGTTVTLRFTPQGEAGKM